MVSSESAEDTLSKSGSSKEWNGYSGSANADQRV